MQRAHRHPVIGRIVQAMVVVVVTTALVPLAHAEARVAALAKLMASSSDKTRLSAVLALAKLGDRAAERPLISALDDASGRVRVVAATTLGTFGTAAALPKLRTLAKEDTSEDVRKAAGNAALKIAKASRAPDVRPGRPSGAAVDRGAAGPSRPGDGVRHPDLYLLVSSSSDDSPGTADKATRRMHAAIVKRVMVEACKSEGAVTASAPDAQRWGLGARHIDLSVTRLDVTRAGGYVEIGAELRIAISDHSGKMLSFLSGGAKVQVPTANYDPAYLGALRREALEDAVRGLFGKLLAHLRDQT
jgi:hypothetical protein